MLKLARATFATRLTYNGFPSDVTMSLESTANMDLLSVKQVKENKLHMAAVNNLARHHHALV